MTNLWENVKARRIQQGISQEEMAKRLDIKQPTYQYYERGNAKKVSADMLKKIASILDITVEELTGNTEVTLQQYPEEIQIWLAKPEAKEFVLNAYMEYLKGKSK